MYINESLKKYIDDLAARQPAPGGGSASALSGALGAALLEMACNFTVGNKKYKDVEETINKHLNSLKKIREEFMALIDEDVKAYSNIYSAFKTKDEKNIDNALKDGYYISLKICELSKSGIVSTLDLAEKSNINLITDVGCGLELLRASFNSGVFNARINLKLIKDSSFVKKGEQELFILKNQIAILYKNSLTRTEERLI